MTATATTCRTGSQKRTAAAHKEKPRQMKRYFTSAAVFAAGMLVVNTATATVVDLSADGQDNVNGAIFTINNTQPAGSGVFKPFLTVQNSPWEQGYNSSTGNFDTKREPQFNHEIRFSDLQMTTINGQSYYGFAIDVNEPNGGGKSTISLNDLSLWTSATTQNSTSTDSNGFFNGSLGTLRYNMAGTVVTYDDQHHGSGQADISVFVPTSYFAGTNANDYVYMFQRWGNTDASEGVVFFPLISVVWPRRQ